ESRAERAELLFSMLAYGCAPRHELRNYGTLAREAHIFRRAIGAYLNFVMRWCQLHGLPILTSIVVGKASGKPEEGFLKEWPNLDLDAEQQKVFHYDWAKIKAPTAEEMKEAVRAIEGDRQVKVESEPEDE